MLIRHLISRIYHKIWYTINYFTRNRIKVINASNTVNHIIQHRSSISRYGDGELGLVLQYKIGLTFKSGFQDYNIDLAKRLADILKNENNIPNHIIGLPGCAFGLGDSYLVGGAQYFWEKFSNRYIHKILNCLNLDTTYYETNFTRFYLSHRNKKKCSLYIKQVQKIWENRDIVIVEGQYSRLGIGNDLFKNASSIKRILCPATNAYDKYNDIITAINLHVSKQDLILLALGQTATVLAYDLAKLGFQAIDLGHIDIEYEWYLRGATNKIAIPNKFTNESINGHIHSELFDPNYQNQIIAKIY